PRILTRPHSVNVEVICNSFFSLSYFHHAPPPAFPTRRSSDLLYKLTVPLCTSRLPLLLNAGPMAVLPVPPLFWKVPVLLIVAGPDRMCRRLISSHLVNMYVFLWLAT